MMHQQACPPWTANSVAMQLNCPLNAAYFWVDDGLRIIDLDHPDAIDRIRGLDSHRVLVQVHQEFSDAVLALLLPVARETMAWRSALAIEIVRHISVPFTPTELAVSHHAARAPADPE